MVFQISLPVIFKIIPAAALAIWTGIAIFISFFTPDNDVNVDEPVKFIAINEDTAVTIRNHESF